MKKYKKYKTSLKSRVLACQTTAVLAELQKESGTYHDATKAWKRKIARLIDAKWYELTHNKESNEREMQTTKKGKKTA